MLLIQSSINQGKGKEKTDWQEAHFELKSCVGERAQIKTFLKLSSTHTILGNVTVGSV
jgi:hypothetical protein